MVNDTNTLNGALSELGETLATNISKKGVTASASDGLTTLANKVLQISGGGGPTILFQDDCSSNSRLSEYGNYVSLFGTSGNGTITYDSTENAYSIAKTNSADRFVGFKLPINVTDNIRITCKAKLTSTSAYNQFGIAIQETSSKYEFLRIRGDKILDGFKNNTNSSIDSNSNVASFNSAYYYLEITYNESSRTVKVYDEHMSLVKEWNLSSVQTYTGANVYLAINTNSTNVYIKSIKVESLGGGCSTTIYEDDCSTDKTNQYTSISIRNTSGAETLTFNSVESAYACSRSASGYALVQFGDVVLQNNMKISADIKLTGTTWTSNGILGFADKDNPTNYGVGGWVQGETYYRIIEYYNGTELQTTTNEKWNYVSTSDYNHHELVYENGTATYILTSPNGTNSKTVSLSLQQSNYIGGKVGLFVECATGTHCYIKNIKVETIGGSGSDCSQYQTQINNAIEYINGDGS